MRLVPSKKKRQLCDSRTDFERYKGYAGWYTAGWSKSLGKGFSISGVLKLNSIVRRYIRLIPSFFVAALNSEDIEVVANPALHPATSKSMAPFKQYLAEWQQRCGTSRFPEGEED